MSGVAVAMSEIVREGTWSLRALGYPYGVAERAAGMLVWTEAVQGNALALLRAGEAAIMQGAALPAPRWSRGHDGARRAAANGKCLLECGPPALDLATADARRLGIGRSVLSDVIGTRLASSLAAIAARRGLATVVVHAPGLVEIEPIPAAGWIFAIPTSSGPAFLTGGLGEELPNELPAPLHVAADDIVAAGKEGHGGFLAIVALPSGPMPDPAAATDWPQRMTDAYRRGVKTDFADYQQLYALEMLTWAPTSERSRAQAGYGRF